MNVFALAGSPSGRSRSSALLRHVVQRLKAVGVIAHEAGLWDIPSTDLVEGNYASSAACALRGRIHSADAVIISTPVYKASIAGGLKSILDLLDEKALAGKLILPLATSGSPAHLLSLEYSFKPILSALGARHILAGVYATEKQVVVEDDGQAFIAEDIRDRLDEASDEIYRFVSKSHFGEISLAA